jgi:spermidine synthase
MTKENDSNSQPGLLLEATVFTCGALVMVYEIIGSRIVAPYIGTSTYVWTSLIGVILAALSLGYWIGGNTADRQPSVRVLAAALFAAGGLVSVTILTKDVVLSMIGAAPFGLELRSVIAALFLFAPASVALGFVIPYATKLRMSSLDRSGRTVGRLYALSTLGSIAGTFAAGFFLIPFVGSVRTLYLIAALLFVISFLLAGFSLNRTSIASLLLFVIGIAANELSSYYFYSIAKLVDVDTEYSRVRVFESVDPRTDRPIKAIMIDPIYVQSVRYLDGDDLAMEYAKFYHLARYYKPDLSHSLMIGGAGYTFPQDYLRTYQNATMDVVEIDPGMTQIAREHFGLKEDPRIRIFHEDGRIFLNNAPEQTYDVVFMDAFGSLFSVPFQLTTIEAIQQIHRTLKDDGVIIFNVGSALEGKGSLFLQAELAAYRSVFADVKLFKVRPDADDSDVQNVIMVARKTASVLPEESDPVIKGLLSHRYDRELEVTVPIPTDDLAPIEYYGSLAQNARSR